jgi:NarL family two-component system response regulator LiaR
MIEEHIRVLIVDDHPVVRKGTRALFDEVPDIEVIGEAADGAESVRQTALLNPDVVLMDLVMPDMDGPQAIAQIKERSPHVHVLVLTSFMVEEKVLPAFRAGAVGYLSKDTDPMDLVKAIRAVYHGESPIHPGVARRLLQELTRRKSEQPDALTAREMEVLQLMTLGYRDQEIASKLNIGEVTVRTHVSRVLSKLRAANRVQAVLLAMREGLVSVNSP